MDDEDLKKDIESPLVGDDNPPFSPPEDINNDLNDPFDRELEEELDRTHPITDANIQQEEVYDEGLSGAAEAEEPNLDDGVEGFNPDQREEA